MSLDSSDQLEAIENAIQLEAIENAISDVAAGLPARRERIATACLQGLLAAQDTAGSCDAVARDAVEFADALIAQLDDRKDQ